MFVKRLSYLAGLSLALVVAIGAPAPEMSQGKGLRKTIAPVASKDDSKPLPEIEQLAAKGVPDAELKLGELYEEGQGIRQDLSEANKWYQKAAFSEYSRDEASFLTYLNGKKIAKNAKGCLPIFRKQAEKGIAEATCKLGYFYAHGIAVKKDLAKSVQLYKQASEAGYADAMNNLGVLYASGQGLARDYSQALKLFQEAADKGCAEALSNLGSMYKEGWGVSRDQKKAAELYLKAAAHGIASARYNLGLLYQQGLGVPQDYKKSASLYQFAAEAKPKLVALEHLSFVSKKHDPPPRESAGLAQVGQTR